MYNQVIELVKMATSIDEYGDAVNEETTREVFAELKSVGMSEKYQAEAVGLKPEVKFVISDFLEYKGEKIIRFRDFGEEEVQEYTVLRTFRTGHGLEIVCQRGINANT